MKLAIIASLLLPLAYGLSCDNVKDKELCNEIMLSDASDEEKQQLIADLSYTDVNYANHDFIYDWNTNIGFNSAPEDVAAKSSGYIKDAWLKIIAVMPSVISEDKLLTSGIGEVLSAYNYRVEIPSGTESRDCKTEFSLVSNDKWLNIHLNNKLIGTSTLTDFTGSDILDFKAALRIKTVTKVKHYETYKYCCRHGEDGRCIKYCKKCKYEDTEYRTDEVNLEDSKRAYHYWPLIKPKIKAVDSYQDTIVGILNISNFDIPQIQY